MTWERSYARNMRCNLRAHSLPRVCVITRDSVDLATLVVTSVSVIGGLVAWSGWLFVFRLFWRCCHVLTVMTMMSSGCGCISCAHIMFCVSGGVGEVAGCESRLGGALHWRVDSVACLVQR